MTDLEKKLIIVLLAGILLMDAIAAVLDLRTTVMVGQFSTEARAMHFRVLEAVLNDEKTATLGDQQISLRLDAIDDKMKALENKINANVEKIDKVAAAKHVQ